MAGFSSEDYLLAALAGQAGGGITPATGQAPQLSLGDVQSAAGTNPELAAALSAMVGQSPQVGPVPEQAGNEYDQAFGDPFVMLGKAQSVPPINVPKGAPSTKAPGPVSGMDALSKDTESRMLADPKLASIKPNEKLANAENQAPRPFQPGTASEEEILGEVAPAEMSAANEAAAIRLTPERYLQEQLLPAMNAVDRSEKFDSNLWFTKLNTGAKIATGLSLAALAVADAMAERRGLPPRNSVAQVVDRLVNQDVMEQKENYERGLQKAKNKMNVYALLRQQGLDAKDALEAAKAYEIKKAGLALDNQKLVQDADLKAKDIAVQYAGIRSAERRNTEDNATRMAIASAPQPNPDASRNERFRLAQKQKAYEKSAPEVAMAFDSLMATHDLEALYNDAVKNGDFRNYNGALSVYLGRFSKGLGKEAGALSEEDIARIKDAFGKNVNIHDTSTWNISSVAAADSPETAKKKFQVLRMIAKRAIASKVRFTSNEDAKRQLLEDAGISEDEYRYLTGASKTTKSIDSQIKD